MPTIHFIRMFLIYALLAVISGSHSNPHASATETSQPVAFREIRTAQPTATTREFGPEFVCKALRCGISRTPTQKKSIPHPNNTKIKACHLNLTKPEVERLSLAQTTLCPKCVLNLNTQKHGPSLQNPKPATASELQKESSARCS